jgi:hypothetical protein
MLTSLLSSLQEKLFSKNYLVSALFPLLLFLIANGLMLRDRSILVSTWLKDFEGLEEKTLAYGVVTTVVLSLAYLFSLLNGVLLELFEGRQPPLSWVARVLCAVQRLQVRALDDNYNELIRTLDSVQRHKTRWESCIAKAKAMGVGTKQCGPYPKNVLEGLVRQTFRRQYWRINGLLLVHDLNIPVKLGRYRAAVTALAKVLATNSAELPTSSSRALLRTEERVLEGLRELRDRVQFERIRLRNHRQFSFPGQINAPDERSTNNLVAPTSFGNIARTMRSYALTRYNLDLDIFWTRLHNSLQRASADYYAVLQDAKVQVDSLVALTFLTAAFVVTWTALSVFVYPSVNTFLIVAISGPIATWALYRMCCNSYRVFADLMRSCVDLFRFRLLEDLHVPLPYGIDEERTLWRTLGESTGYGVESPIVYHHLTGNA